MSARHLLATAGDSVSSGPAPRDPEFTIGDLSREFDITLRTLRFYEHKGMIKPRREGLVRYYDAGEKARLALILKGKQLGFTLKEIRAMLASSDTQTGGGLGLSREQIRSQLEALRAERARIDAGIAELEARLAG